MNKTEDRRILNQIGQDFGCYEDMYTIARHSGYGQGKGKAHGSGRGGENATRPDYSMDAGYYDGRGGRVGR